MHKMTADQIEAGEMGEARITHIFVGKPDGMRLLGRHGHR
jgi:hypothetical protein